MDVILRLKGIKKEEILSITKDKDQIVVQTPTKNHYFTIEKKKGSFILVQKDVKVIHYECKPLSK
jgi:hypothetical protein